MNLHSVSFGCFCSFGKCSAHGLVQIAFGLMHTVCTSLHFSIIYFIFIMLLFIIYFYLILLRFFSERCPGGGRWMSLQDRVGASL